MAREDRSVCCNLLGSKLQGLLVQLSTIYTARALHQITLKQRRQNQQLCQCPETINARASPKRPPMAAAREACLDEVSALK